MPIDKHVIQNVHSTCRLNCLENPGIRVSPQELHLVEDMVGSGCGCQGPAGTGPWQTELEFGLHFCSLLLVQNPILSGKELLRVN